MKYSLTYAGLIVAVVGTFLMQSGFSEQCSNELITNIPMLVGSLLAAFGRWRKGDVTIAGFKK